MALDITTLELWPEKARRILQEKGLSISSLETAFKNLLFPWEDNYDQQRQLFSSQIQERPLMIITFSDESEILTLYELLEDYQLTVRIVGGRHSTLLASPDVFAVMSSFNTIELKNLLTVDGGVTQGQVNDYLFNIDDNYHFVGAKPSHPNTLLFPGGSAVTVGCAGISSAGGVGTLRRRYSLTIDSILSFRIVIPPTINRKAKVVVASKHQYREIFWSLKGGGASNFGFVTEIVYQHPVKVPRVLVYEIDFAWDDAARVITEWQQFAVHLPTAFNEDLSIFTTNDGKTVVNAINLTGAYVIPEGMSDKEARHVIRKESRYLGGKIKFYEVTTYAKAYRMFARDRVYHNFSTSGAIFVNEAVSSKMILNASRYGIEGGRTLLFRTSTDGRSHSEVK